MSSYEDQVRHDMEIAAKEQQVASTECPIEESIDGGFSIGRMIRRIGAKIGLVKHPNKQTIGDIRRGKVGDSSAAPRPSKRKK